MPGARLFGIAGFQTYFKFDTNPAYTAIQSIADFRALRQATPNPSVLKVAPFKVMNLKRGQPREFGYRRLPVKNFLVDAYIAINGEYRTFLGKTAVGRPLNGGPLAFVANPLTTEQ